MTNTQNDLDSLNPTDDDLLALDAKQESYVESLTPAATDDDDESYLYVNDVEDERYREGRNGMPSWSLFG